MLEDIDLKDLRSLADEGKMQVGSGVVAIVGVTEEGKAGVVVGVTPSYAAPSGGCPPATRSNRGAVASVEAAKRARSSVRVRRLRHPGGIQKTRVGSWARLQSGDRLEARKDGRHPQGG